MIEPITIKDIAAAAILIFSLVFGNNALAKDSQTADRFIEKFDENQDGFVSRSEYPGSDEAFSRLDANGDGAISSAEVAGSMKRRVKSGGNFMERFDANGDGKISNDEFPRSEEHFARLDTNGDGYITEDEAPAGRRDGSRGSRRL